MIVLTIPFPPSNKEAIKFPIPFRASYRIILKKTVFYGIIIIWCREMLKILLKIEFLLREYEKSIKALENRALNLPTRVSALINYF